MTQTTARYRFGGTQLLIYFWRITKLRGLAFTIVTLMNSAKEIFFLLFSLLSNAATLLLVTYQCFMLPVLLALSLKSILSENKQSYRKYVVSYRFLWFLTGFFGFRCPATKTGWRKGRINVPGKRSFFFFPPEIDLCILLQTINILAIIKY